MRCVIKRSKIKGNGLFANKDLTSGEQIISVDLSRLKSRTLDEWNRVKTRDDDHMDYVGRGRYVISHHPYSYINHSCNPNVLVKHISISKSACYAMRNIKKGEELTCDYGVNAMDQIDDNKWSFECSCRGKNCRKKILCAFFRQPIETQKKYFKYLPPSIKRKHRNKLGCLAKT